MVGEKIYTIHLVVFDGFKDHYKTTKLSANSIREDDRYVTFYNQWGDCIGRFKKDSVIGFGVEAE